MKYNSSPNLNHGVVNVGDLPIPFDIVLNSSALVVLITFVYLKISWKESIIVPREESFNNKESLTGKLFGFFILFLLGFLLFPLVFGMLEIIQSNFHVRLILDFPGIFLTPAPSTRVEIFQKLSYLHHREAEKSI